MKATSKPAGGKSEGDVKSGKVGRRGNQQTNKALSESKALYRKTLDNMLEGCQILGHDWRYLYLNATAEGHNHRPNQELLGKTYMEMWPGIEATQVFAEIKRCMEERVSVQLENKFAYPSGAIGWFKLSIQPIPEGVLILSIDITEYKRAEEQASQINRLYATLSQINQMIVRVKDREDLYQSICDIAVQFGGFSLAWIGLLDEASGDVRPVVANGFDIGQWPFPTINIHHGELQNGLVATAIRTSQVVTSEDIQTDQRTQGLHTQINDYGFHSSAAVPFRLKGKTVGTVCLVSNEVGFFKAKAETHLLEEMGLDISFALDVMETESQRKQAEEALIESEERFSQAFYQSPIGIALVDLKDFTIRDVNNALLDMMKLVREQLVGQNALLLDLQIDPEVQAAIGKELQEHGLFRNKEVQLHLPSGEFLHILNSGALITIGGKPHSLTLMQDVTERKQAETELRFHASIVESAHDAIIGKTLDGIILSWNPGAERLYGYEAEEVIGKSLTILVPPERPDELAFILESIKKGQRIEHYETVRLTKDGRRVDVSLTVSPLLGDDGQIVSASTIARDISERKQAEKQIRRQLRYLNALRMIDIAISSSFDLHVVLDVVLEQVLSQLSVDASAVLLYNPHLQTIEYAAGRGFRSDALQHTQLKLGEGYASRAVIERKTIHISDLMETGSKLANSLLLEHELFVDYYGAALIAKGEVIGALEIYHRSRLKVDSEWLEFLETLAGQAAIAIDNAQLFESLQHSNIDLERRVAERTTELNRTNAELEHANRIKDEFLANMSHELRTPLTSILGLSESLLEQRRGSLSEYQQKSLQIIASSGHHLLDLINDILDLSKIEAGKFDFYPQPIAVDEICRASLAFIKAQAVKKSIAVTYIQDTSVSKIFVDPRRLKQILVNLLSNAVKFTPENGKVILQVNANLEQDLIQFSVIDNGIGIAQEDLQRLFQPFVQVESGLNRQHDGTGLGLALVQKLTDLHGGSVQVGSEVGKGSRFTVNLPCLQEELAKLEELESQSTHPIRKRTETTEVPGEVPSNQGIVLLADDNMPSVLTIGEYLESHGYEVVVAHDGLEAVEKAKDLHPDLILMDIQMPVMNGLEAIARLRAEAGFTNTPIIALTALAMVGDRERVLLAGANEYMSKPVSLKALRQEIASLLQRRSDG